MKTSFNSGFFAGNRRKLRELFTGTAPIVITGNALLQRNSDMAFPFRQDSNFWYLTGITEPEVVLVMDKDKEYLIVPDRHDVRNIFDGEIDSQELSRKSGIAEVLQYKDGWKRLGSRMKKVKHVVTLAPPPRYAETHEFFTNPARRALLSRLKEYSPGVQLLDLREHLAKLRMIKQPIELESIQASIDLTVSAFDQLKKHIAEYSYEYEVDAFLSHAYRSNGGYEGYRSIIASGGNACVLHYDSNQDKLAKKALLLIDSGAELEYYSADITRTYSLGTPTKRQKSIHEAVIDVQDYALSNLKPGISIKENELMIEQYMGEKLRGLGLIKTIERDSVRKYFPHATSHFLGIDVHDVGDYEAPLKPGMVLTVEPGIYVPEEALGVRIEDDVLITEEGARVLSDKLPRSL